VDHSSKENHFENCLNPSGQENHREYDPTRTAGPTYGCGVPRVRCTSTSRLGNIRTVGNRTISDAQATEWCCERCENPHYLIVRWLFCPKQDSLFVGNTCGWWNLTVESLSGARIFATPRWDCCWRGMASAKTPFLLKRVGARNNVSDYFVAYDTANPILFCAILGASSAIVLHMTCCL
jgi:hypothetical protein